MKKVLILTLLFSSLLFSENNETNNTKNENSSTKLTKEQRIEINLQKQIAKEKMFGKEQSFYHGKDYDLKSSEVDEASLDSIPNIEPDYEFDMDEGVYD